MKLLIFILLAFLPFDSYTQDKYPIIYYENANYDSKNYLIRYDVYNNQPKKGFSRAYVQVYELRLCKCLDFKTMKAIIDTVDIGGVFEAIYWHEDSLRLLENIRSVKTARILYKINNLEKLLENENQNQNNGRFTQYSLRITAKRHKD